MLIIKIRFNTADAADLTEQASTAAHYRRARHDRVVACCSALQALYQQHANRLAAGGVVIVASRRDSAPLCATQITATLFRANGHRLARRCSVKGAVGPSLRANLQRLAGVVRYFLSAMPTQEDRPGQSSSDSEPRFPVALTPELADFLRRQQGYVCVTQATSEGTVYLLRVPGHELASLRGTMPIGLRHELYEHPSAPVIRTVLTIVDQPQRPLRVETFCNVAEEDQQADFAALADQERLLLLFYDEQLRHRLSKLVPYPERSDVPRILARAEQLRAAIPPWRFNFDRAKAAVMQHTSL